DLALDGERRLPKAVTRNLFTESVYLQVAEVGIVEENSVRLGLLVHECRSYGPVVIEVDLERRAAAVNILVVEILLFETGVRHRRAVMYAADDYSRGRRVWIGN